MTPADRAGIVEARLSGASFREIAAQFDRPLTTVHRTWANWWRAEARKHAGRIEAVRVQRSAELRQVAADARRQFRQAVEAEDAAAAARFLAEERQALVAAARVEGVDQVKVQHSGEVAVSAVSFVEEVIDAEVVEDQPALPASTPDGTP